MVLYQFEIGALMIDQLSRRWQNAGCLPIILRDALYLRTLASLFTSPFHLPDFYIFFTSSWSLTAENSLCKWYLTSSSLFLHRFYFFFNSMVILNDRFVRFNLVVLFWFCVFYCWVCCSHISLQFLNMFLLRWYFKSGCTWFFLYANITSSYISSTVK